MMNQLTRLRLLGQLSIAVIFILPHAACAEAGLQVSSLGKLSSSLSAHDETFGAEQKWSKVRQLLGESADRVAIKQLGGSLGGNTSVRNSSPLVWKPKGYFRRARDLGQVFTAPSDFTLDAIVLITGNAHLAFLPGAAGAEVFVQFFGVKGDPVIDDRLRRAPVSLEFRSLVSGAR